MTAQRPDSITDFEDLKPPLESIDASEVSQVGDDLWQITYVNPATRAPLEAIPGCTIVSDSPVYMWNKDDQSDVYEGVGLYLRIEKARS